MTTITSNSDVLKSSFMRMILLLTIVASIDSILMLTELFTTGSLSLISLQIKEINSAFLWVAGNQFIYYISRNVLSLRETSLTLRIMCLTTFALFAVTIGSAMGDAFTSSKLSYIFSIVGACINLGTYIFGLYNAFEVSKQPAGGYSFKLK